MPSGLFRSLLRKLFSSPRRDRRRRRQTVAPVEALESRCLLTNFLVTTTLDAVAADGVVSLREAIQAANTNAAVNEAPAGEASGDAITFDASLTGGTIVLGGTELAITSELAIDGEDRGVTIDANDLSRIFRIDTSEDVMLANMSCTRGNAGPTYAGGGAIGIFGTGKAHLSGIVVTNSTAWGGGALRVSTRGTAIVDDSEFFNNTSSVQGGAIACDLDGMLEINRSTIRGNSAGTVGGGIQLYSAVLVMTDSNLDNNTAESSGGGLDFYSTKATIVRGSVTNNTVQGLHGGGINHQRGTLTIRGTRIDGNVVLGEGNSPVVGGGGIYHFDGTVNVTSNAVISNNRAEGTQGGDGGGILSLGGHFNVTDSVISDNSAAGAGGGIWNDRGSTFTLTRSTIARNMAVGTGTDLGGGGICNDGGNMNVYSSQIINNQADGDAGAGGGIYNTGAGTLVISQSEISNNSAVADGGGSFNTATGGGIFSSGATVVIEGSQLSGNSAVSNAFGNGGAIGILSGRVTISNSVFDGNFAGTFGGGIYLSSVVQEQLMLIDCLFESNTSAGLGGALSLDSNASIIGGTITRNSASGGGGVSVRGNATVELEGTVVTANTADAGAGISNAAGQVTLRSGTIVADNTSTFGGGGVFTQGPLLSVIDSVIRGNVANDVGGGGVYNTNNGTVQIDSSEILNNQSNGAFAGAGGIYNSIGTLQISRSIISDNSAVSNGGGIRNRGPLTLDDGSQIFNNTALAGGGIYTDTSGSLDLEDPGVVFSNSPDNFGGPPPNFTDASGWWIIDGQAAEALQLNGVITFINEFGDATSGYFTTPSQLVAEDWGNLVGNLVGNEIQWTNGTTWGRVPDLMSTGMFNGGGLVLVQQLGVELNLINERGGASKGHFISSTQIVADDWGGLLGTVVGDEIQWANLSVWTAADPADGAEVNLSGAWAFDRQDATILQNGDTLLFVNERGDAAAGAIVDSTHVVATGWGNLSGTIDPVTRRILWDNGTVWDRVPVLDRNENWHTDDGLPTAVSQLGVRVLITNEFGDRSDGRFDPLRGIVATDFNVIGEIDYDAAAILWDIPFRWNNSFFGARDAVFADANNWPWLVP